MPKDQSEQSIQVITRAAGILRTLARDTGGMSLGQIATQVNLPRSTVQRIVGALQLEGLVAVKKGGRGIGLGPEIQSLAEATGSGMTGRMRRAMQAIGTETGETVDLALFEDDQLKFIDQIVGNHRLRTVSNVGEDFPLTSTANGKAALAQLDQGDAAKLALAEFGKLKSSASLSKFLAELTKIENGALAQDLDENTDGICALGFALKDDDGRIYALSVPVPSSRFARVQSKLQTVLSNWYTRLQAEQATEG